MFRLFPLCNPRFDLHANLFAQPLLLGEKAELTGKHQLYSVSPFGGLAEYAEPHFQKRIHRRFESEKRFKQVCKFDITKVASSDECQGINPWTDNNRSETSFAQQNAKTVRRVIPVTAGVERFEVRGRTDENAISLKHSIYFPDQLFWVSYVLKNLPGITHVNRVVPQGELNPS